MSGLRTYCAEMDLAGGDIAALERLADRMSADTGLQVLELAYLRRRLDAVLGLGGPVADPGVAASLLRSARGDGPPLAAA